MSRVQTERVTFDVPAHGRVSGMLSAPTRCTACYVMAHGAGAGMEHPFMAAVASGLANRDIAVLRYQFPYMERGSKRPDRPAIAHATVRAAVDEATRLMPGVPLLAGGKSFGGRMTSQAQSEQALPGVRGLVFFGFPLHAAKKPSEERAAHVFGITIPMLFLQGTRDALAEFDLIDAVVRRLGPAATLEPIKDADHSFHVPARSGRTDEQVLSAALAAMTAWFLAQTA